MKTTAIYQKHSTAWLLALAMSCPFQLALANVNSFPDSRNKTESRADAIADSGAPASPLGATDALMRSRVTEAYDRAPLTFEANVGQANDARVKFLSRGSGYNVVLSSTEATFAFFETQNSLPESETGEQRGSMRQPRSSQSRVARGQAGSLRISMLGADKTAKVKGLDELPGRSNYFIGNDPRKWRTNVPTYSRVEYESIYRGVDLAYYGNREQLEYDFIVAPGASYKVIRIRFEGGDRVSLDGDGDLVIEFGYKKVYQRRPIVYQELNGIKEAIAGRYVVSGRREVGFEIGGYDANRPLVIDPVISYSTFLDRSIAGVAVDPNSSAYVTGTRSLDAGRGFDAFVTKLNPEGTAVMYSTFLGGAAITGGVSNQGFDIAVDSNFNACVTGSTGSKDFPTTLGAFQTTLGGRISGFVTKLNSTGDGLVYSTYLGANDSFSASSGRAISVDRAGNAYVTGATDSFKFPVVNPAQSVNLGGFCLGGDVIVPCPLDAFVSKLNPSGTALVYSTYLGGEGIDVGSDIAVDGTGSAYVVGTTSAVRFPTKNPLQPLSGGSNDLFIAKLSAEGNQLVYSTLFGGSGNDTANGVAVDLSGNAYIIGTTSSTDFPTTANALQRTHASSTAFKSTDGGTTWSAISRGLRTDLSIEQLAIDPINSSTLYANANGALFKSTDAGSSWQSLRFQISITTFAIDPINSSTLYAGLFFPPGGGGVQKSTDGGETWFAADSGLESNLPIRFVIDPKHPGTIYAAVASGSFGQSVGVFKSIDGGINWVPSSKGISRLPLTALALAPSKPKRLYAFSGGRIFKSTNRGKKWKPGGFSTNVLNASLAVDPLNPNIVYIATQAGVSKSTDGAETWASTPLRANIGFIEVDPKNPSTIYAAGRDVTTADKNFKSTDGGATWKEIGRISANFIATFAIDPNNTSIVYAGSEGFPFLMSGDAFVAKINPVGTALVYSTYLGGTSDDIGKAIAVDAQGNAYLTGQTSSEDFLIKSALQPRKLGSRASYDAFLTKLDPAGDPIYSTYLGGGGNDDGRGITLDTAGGVFIAGSTDSDDFPTVNPIGGTRNGRFGFVTKVVDTGRNGAVSQARTSRW